AYGPAKHCHAVELFAWIDVDSEQDLAKQKVSLRDAERRGEPLRHLTRLRRSVATEHGERMVQAALETFLNKEALPLRALWQQCAVVAEALSSRSWRRGSELLSAVTGFGGGQGTHAAEILRDLFSTRVLDSCTDLGTWAPLDVPTRRCLNRLAGREPGAEPPPGQLLDELLEVYRKRQHFWPGDILGQASVELLLPDLR
ncbi:unnamed protein product, partial [Polarella glacialis]